MPNTEDLQSREFTTVAIEEVVPYWRNPRNITDQDVARVMSSIEKYGYQNPIILDPKRVIITGHARYLALRRLGWKEIPVLISDMPPDVAQEYRIIDNRAGEFVEWDRKLLLNELTAFNDPDMVTLFFPEVQLDLGEIPTEALIPPPKERKERPVNEIPQQKEIFCPHCFHEFNIEEAEEV